MEDVTTLQQLGQEAGEAYLASNYRFLRCVGHGAFGKVHAAEHLITGREVAIKILSRRTIRRLRMEEKVDREIAVMRLLDHPHITRMYEVVETSEHIYVVMEYVEAGELLDYIVERGRLPEEEARAFFQQLISGVAYCHDHMVVHRDLKPENLLLDSARRIKIADFGLSNVVRSGHFLKTSCGSPNYVAPEVISGQLYTGPEADIWSSGVTLYVMLCGALPFDGDSMPAIFEKIKAGKYSVPSHLSPEACDLISKMLVVNPQGRLSMQDIRQHPWLVGDRGAVEACQRGPVPMAEDMSDGPSIDTQALLEAEILGIDRHHLLDSLMQRQQNRATVAYHLLLHSRRQEPSFGSLPVGELACTAIPRRVQGVHKVASAPAATARAGSEQPLTPLAGEATVAAGAWRLAERRAATPTCEG